MVFRFEIGGEKWNWPVSGADGIRAFRELLLRAQIGYSVSGVVASDGEQPGVHQGDASAGTFASRAPAPDLAALCEATNADVTALILDSGGLFTACPLCGKPATDHPKEVKSDAR